MRIYSISLLFVVQVWNIGFYKCLELMQITQSVIEITHYQGDYTTSYYIYIVTTPVVQQYVLESITYVFMSVSYVFLSITYVLVRMAFVLASTL